MKNNPNQICWLLEKVQRSSDTQNGFTTFQQFLDNQQYTNRGILRYEKMFGAGYVSTGGPSTTKVAIWLQDTQITKKNCLSVCHEKEILQINSNYHFLCEGVCSSRVLVVNSFLNQIHPCCFTSSSNLKYLLLKFAFLLSSFDIQECKGAPLGV